MGGEIKRIQRVTTGIFDTYREVFLDRGMFVNAPVSLIAAYPGHFENPLPGWQKLGIQVREFETFDPVTGFKLTPKVEIPVPVGPAVGLAIEVPPAVAEPVAAKAPEMEIVTKDIENDLPDVPEAPAMSKPRRSRRNAIIR